MDEKTIAALQNMPGISEEEAMRIAKQSGIKEVEKEMLKKLAKDSPIPDEKYLEDLASRRSESFLKKQEAEAAKKMVPKLPSSRYTPELTASKTMSLPEEVVKDINIGEYQKLKQAESLAQQAARKGALSKMMSGVTKSLRMTPGALLGDIILNPSEVVSEEEEMKERERLIRERMKK